MKDAVSRHQGLRHLLKRWDSEVRDALDAEIHLVDRTSSFSFELGEQAKEYPEWLLADPFAEDKR